MEVGPEDDLRKGIPDADAIKYAAQKMLSTNPEIYKDGFVKITMWCKAEPAWVIEKGTYKEKSLLELIIELIETLIVDEGRKSGEACELIVSCAQNQVTRDLIYSKDGVRLVKAVIRLLEPKAKVANSARAQAAKCIENLVAQPQLKERLRIAGAIPLLLETLSVDDAFQSAYYAIGALMNFCTNKVSVNSLHKSNAIQIVGEFVDEVENVKEEQKTSFHLALTSRARYVQVNMQINDPADLLNFRIVDPAQQAGDIGGGPRGMIKMGDMLAPQNVRKASQVDAAKILKPTLSQIVKAVDVGVSTMQAKNDNFLQGSRVMRRTKSKGNWGTLFQQYIK